LLALLSTVATLAACSGVDPAVAGWETTVEDLDGALVGVWGTAEDDVWFVGSDPGDGPGAYVFQWDGEELLRHDSGAPGGLWWVHATQDSVWCSGEAGGVARLDRAAGSWAPVPAPTSVTLFGIYEVAPGDVWAVGGDTTTSTGVILRGNAAGLSEVPTPGGVADGLVPFKLWGTASDDLWIVGLGGVALHWDGSAFARVEVPLGRPLFTVHGAGELVVAVGGAQSGHIVELTSDAAANVTPSGLVPQLNGVYADPEAGAVAAGLGGAIWNHDADGSWVTDESAPQRPTDFHAVWRAPSGETWAVGGLITIDPLRSGVIAHYGLPLGPRDPS
jgi:hypothetical protein